MFRFYASEPGGKRDTPDQPKGRRQTLLRQMRARKKIERRKDQARLRKELEDVW